MEKVELHNIYIGIALILDLYDTMCCSLRTSYFMLTEELRRSRKALDVDLRLAANVLTGAERRLAIDLRNDQEEEHAVERIDFITLHGLFWEQKLRTLDDTQYGIVSRVTEDGLYVVEVVFFTVCF